MPISDRYNDAGQIYKALNNDDHRSHDEPKVLLSHDVPFSLKTARALVVHQKESDSELSGLLLFYFKVNATQRKQRPRARNKPEPQ
ncbi:hypothetical protein Pan189_07380 [Stratiformator vulcanicus]|uniref:Uncharacterized protein n=1 Tax=Stratiformator vulcanicus TaxID=2527980 RepID=A0A517QXK6_9PLAN|nr:hypothetical protein Pan189_07380 [Stratiformator vulcanicus]